jgi:hypothetical protein
VWANAILSRAADPRRRSARFVAFVIVRRSVELAIACFAKRSFGAAVG